MLLNYTYTEEAMLRYGGPIHQLIEKAHGDDAAFDLRTVRDIELLPGHMAAAFTGIRVAIPNGQVGLVTPRSGLAKTGLTIPNSPGVIDPTYRGEIIVLLQNDGAGPMYFDQGDRIAQLLVMPLTITTPNCITPAHFDTLATERGTGGFGSTGRN